MNEDNRKKVWKLIQKQGDLIKEKLRPHPHHPKGRNPYAHVCGIIKSYYGLSYKDIEDEKVIELQNFIRNVKD
tara:strand:+ start:1818 stop:2036 length:219 start_codon:yes stop_codon:yes gene_type:complete